MTQLPKLVRDKIPDIIRERGATPHVRSLDGVEFYASLLAKIREELSEFEADPSAEELADLAEVLHGLAESLQIPYKVVEEVRAKKYEAKGGFNNHILLESIDE
ncbi:MAG TPA: nucleoside triphosphate pyrophosphohydrolase [Pyrinomonadaceae bacterium]|jgi:predicted house-cleaning noncanonical NTP pyrophosphatase (MazG superfamily)|nr:nucleoside triphosphate pyrophosphohydrolase [Pyrinomonadaceae bacterium]